MTSAQTKLAVRLYRAYKCETREYRQLAESLGMNTGDLNAKVWRILYDERLQASGQGRLIWHLPEAVYNAVHARTTPHIPPPQHHRTGRRLDRLR